MNLGIGKLKNYLEMECRKIKFRKLETRKINFKDGMLENEISKTGNPKNYFKDGMSEN